MNNWKIQTKMLAGFGVVLTVLLCLGLYTRTQLKHIDVAAHRITDDTLPGSSLIAQYRILTQERKLVLRNHLAASSPLEMNRLEGGQLLELYRHHHFYHRRLYEFRQIHGRGRVPHAFTCRRTLDVLNR